MTPTLHKVARDGAILGDFTFGAIRKGMDDGTLRATDHVWAPGQGKWILLGELATLAKPAPTKTAPAGEPAGSPSGWPTGVLGWITLPFVGLLKAAGYVVSALAVVMKWVFVIGLGLFIGMILEGRSPRRHPENDPLHDPYAGRRDRDFDDPYRDV